MQQADDVSSYAREDRPRIHGVRSLMSYSNWLHFPREDCLTIYSRVAFHISQLTIMSLGIIMVRIEVSDGFNS